MHRDFMQETLFHRSAFVVDYCVHHRTQYVCSAFAAKIDRCFPSCFIMEASHFGVITHRYHGTEG